MDPITSLLGGLGSLVDGGVNAYNGSENRKLSRRGLAEQEKNGQFQRLMSLIQGAQGTQQGMGNAQRLFSLRQPSAF